MVTNYNDEIKAYVLELLELCLNSGFTFEYMQQVEEVIVRYPTADGECKILDRCYLNSPDAVTDLIMLIVIVNAHARIQEVRHDLVS